MTFLVIGVLWLAMGLLATIVMVAIGRAGRWEDEHRGSDQPSAAVVRHLTVA
jgi:hypothetical protein